MPYKPTFRHAGNFEDAVQALLLLRSMPDSWDMFVVSLSNLTQYGNQILKMVKSSKLNKEARIKEKSYASSYYANVVESRDKNENHE